MTGTGDKGAVYSNGKFIMASKNRDHKVKRASSPPEGDATKLSLPHVELQWTEAELKSLAALMEEEPAKPTEALRRAMRS